MTDLDKYRIKITPSPSKGFDWEVHEFGVSRWADPNDFPSWHVTNDDRSTLGLGDLAGRSRTFRKAANAAIAGVLGKLHRELRLILEEQYVDASTVLVRLGEPENED